MTAYLISLAIGPVQGFIAAARRTRDLWFGSEVLSEVSKAAAKSLHENHAELIFPAPGSPSALEPKSDFNVGNKLLAVAQTDSPGKVLDSAKDSARSRWRQIAETARAKAQDSIRSEIWNQQIDDVLELYCAWVPLQVGDGAYAQARGRLEQLLGARKTTRDFPPAAVAFDAAPGFGLPKSSLDAARETVLVPSFTAATRRKLGLSKGEQLDCPGIVKRLGGDPEQFPPVTRVALEPWLERVSDNDLSEAKAFFECLVGHQLITRVRPRRYNRFPYDGGFLFPARIEAENRSLEGAETAAIASLNAGKTIRDKLHEKYGQPTPYFAVLVADGDNMGALIDTHDTKNAHLAIASALARFAGQARQIVEDHKGACVYAGGDDVLALLPVHRAVGCSHKLYEAFDAVMTSSANTGSKPPTLSVGLGIGHVLTPFARLLDLGRRAERLAKDGAQGTINEHKRNALAVIVGVRSGAEICVRGRWDSQIHTRLEQWMAYYREDRLPDKVPYDLRQAATRMTWAKGREDYNTIAKQEACRILAKKRSHAGARELSTEVKYAIRDAIQRYGIEAINVELLVARWLSEKAKE